MVVGEARQLLFLLDRMRKRAAVKHAGERLGVFGLTELDQGRCCASSSVRMRYLSFTSSLGEVYLAVIPTIQPVTEN